MTGNNRFLGVLDQGRIKRARANVRKKPLQFYLEQTLDLAKSLEQTLDLANKNKLRIPNFAKIFVVALSAVFWRHQRISTSSTATTSLQKKKLRTFRAAKCRMPVCHQHVRSDGNDNEKRARPHGENHSATDKCSIPASADQSNQSWEKTLKKLSQHVMKKQPRQNTVTSILGRLAKLANCLNELQLQVEFWKMMVNWARTPAGWEMTSV